MKVKAKTTRKQFCLNNKTLQSLRRTDPIQFDVLYNEWRLS